MAPTDRSSSSNVSTSAAEGYFRGRLSPAWWHPAESLGARLAAFLLLAAIGVTLAHAAASDRLARRSERELVRRLAEEGAARERVQIRRDADRRIRELDEGAAELLSVLRAAADAARAALQAGPSVELPADELTEEPGFPLRTATRGASAAIVSRVRGLTPAARRDLAATRRLESSFTALATVNPQISAAFVNTASGVLRAVPWQDMRRLIQAGFSADFTFPGQQGARLLEMARDAGGQTVLWTPVYDDAYSNRGRIVSVMTLVSGVDGPLAVVGLDWAFGELLTRRAESTESGTVELIATSEGRIVVAVQGGAELLPRRTQALEQEAGLVSLATLRADVDTEVRVAGEPVLISARWFTRTGWQYLRLVSLPAVRASIEADVAPVFASAREGRRRVQLASLALLALLSVALVAVGHRATAPIRKLARFADALLARSALPTLPGVDRRDEVGRLARALRDLDGRVQRRIRSMEGLHDLSRTAALMTEPSGTFARLTRRIAELVGAQKSWISIWEPDTRSLVFTPPGFGLADDVLRGVRVPLSDQSLPILAYRSGDTLISQDLSSDPRISRELKERLGVSLNAILVPLRTEVGVLGVLAVCDKEGGFDDEDRAAIRLYADQAAMILRNARLYEEVKLSFQRLREAHRSAGDFLVDVDRELREPLESIAAASAVLEASADDAVKREGERIVTSARRLLGFLKDLKSYSKRLTPPGGEES